MLTCALSRPVAGAAVATSPRTAAEPVRKDWNRKVKQVPAEIFACPRCDRSPLEAAENSIQCRGCDTTYPIFDGIPWLFAEPAAAVGEWRERLGMLVAKRDHDATELERRLTRRDLPDTTRSRLQLLAEAYRENGRQLSAILEPMRISAATSYSTRLALRTRLPAQQDITTYYANVHRDWGWGETENAASLDLVRKALGESRDLGTVVTLGAGACRLAYDIHRELDADRSFALDINPFLLFLAARLIRGEELQLHEFPIAPRTLADNAVMRRLAAPAAADNRFHLVLADALRPPFLRESIDTVVTPWLVDIVAEEFSTLARRINGLLRTGGRWIMFGSLSFANQDPALRYSIEEIIELIAQAGFESPSPLEETIPYMCSPASRHGRRERVVCFATAKKKGVKKVARHNALPDWIVEIDQPVPLLRSFEIQAMSTRVYALIMGMIDGRRSIRDMAVILEQKRLMTRQDAEPAIRGFLIKMYDESQHGGNG